MATIPEMKTKIAKLPINLDRMDGIVNGPATGPTSEVQVDSGKVKTLARLAAEAAVDAGTRAAIDGNNVSPYADDWRSALNVPSSADRRLRAFPTNNRVALLGDSITASGIANGVIPGVSPDANALRNSTRGMTFWVPFLTRQRFVSPQELNFGVSGQNSAQILARVDQVIASGAGVCVYLGGTNDLGGSIATTKANLAATFKALSDANVLIIAVSILPRTVSGGAQYGFINEINAWMAEQQAVYPGFRFIDATFQFGDEWSVNMSPRTGYSYDGLHPMGIGMRNVARVVAEYLNTLLPDPPYRIRVTDHFSATHLTAGYLNPNPFVRGTGGAVGVGVTGTAPDSWSLGVSEGGGNIGSLTVAGSRVTDSRGMDAQCILIGGTATGGYQTVVTMTQYGYSLPHPVQAGDHLYHEADVEFAGGAEGIAGIGAYVCATVGGVEYFAWDGYPIVSDAFSQDALSGTLRTPDIVLTGTPTLIHSGYYIYLMNSVSTPRGADIRISSGATRATRPQ